MAEILASLDDINANLPADEDMPVIVADDDNSALVQISVARVVRGYLSRVIDNSTLLAWTTPESTPEIIREIAGKLIASQVYYNRIAQASPDVPANSYAQHLYDEAVALMTQIIAGDITIPGILTNSEQLSDLDYWPNSSTDRAFTMGQQF